MVYKIDFKQERSNCSADGFDAGGKGTTLWFSDDVTLAPFGNHTWTFTDTRPCCYDPNSGTNVCLIVYDMVTDQSPAPGIACVAIGLNGIDMGATIHSPIGGNNITQAFDLVMEVITFQVSKIA